MMATESRSSAAPPARATPQETIVCVDPASGETLQVLRASARDDVDRAVRLAETGLDEARGSSPAVRARLLGKIGRALERDGERLADLECRDTGKPISQARADVAAAAHYFQYYAGAIETFQGETVPLGPDYFDYIEREPWGVCGQIIPWNYPLQVASRCVAPALAMGNAVILKPSEQACITPLELVSLARASGLREGLFQVLVGYGDVGAALVEHPGVRHITFVGSPTTGRQVAETAARRLAPVQLELGGKSPNVVFADADLEQAVPVVVRALLQNAGQSCSAGARLLVQEPVFDEVIDRVKRAFSNVTLGPGRSDPDLGPLISQAQFERASGIVERAHLGARVIMGGKRADGPGLAAGYYMEPTLIVGVDPDSEIWNEEVFGPVLAAASFVEEEEAVELANRSPFGLIAGVWTSDLSRAHRVAGRLEAGQVFVNSYGVGGGVSLPFGGYKRSGYGRSKGLEALRAYSQTKNVCIAL
jgi:aldehyde dehydrogenase (NAD+)